MTEREARIRERVWNEEFSFSLKLIQCKLYIQVSDTAVTNYNKLINYLAILYEES